MPQPPRGSSNYQWGEGTQGDVKPTRPSTSRAKELQQRGQGPIKEWWFVRPDGEQQRIVLPEVQGPDAVDCFIFAQGVTVKES